MERFLLKFSLSELQTLVRTHGSDRVQLEQIAHELSFRSSSAAILLQEKVQDQLDALESFGAEARQSLREAPEEEIWRLRQELEEERSSVLQLKQQLEDERASRPSAEEVGKLLLHLAEERRVRADLTKQGIALRQKIEELSSQTLAPRARPPSPPTRGGT